MAEDFEIKFSGLEGLQTKLEEVRARYPYKEEDILLKLGATLKIIAKDKTPLGKDKKHVRNQYKLSKVNYEKDGTNITMTNKSPLFHLLENGHKIVRGGRLVKGGTEIGSAPGLHMVEKSMIELDTTIPATVGAWLDGVLGGTQ
jgi:hypothetical protein